MTVFPADGIFTAESRTNEQACIELNNFLKTVKQMWGATSEEALVISSGRIVPTRAVVRIDTEAGAPLDDLDFIGNDNLPVGCFMLLRISDSARKVNIRHNRGTIEEIFLSDAPVGGGYVLSNSGTRMMFQRTSTQWLQVGPPMFGTDREAFRSWLGLTAFAVGTAATPTEILNATGSGIVVAGNMTLLKPFESAEATIVVSGNGSVAHSLGGKPNSVWAVLRNKVTQWGYLVGEEVHIGDKVAVSATTTNVSWAFPATGLQIIEKNGGALRSITDSSWRLVVYARR